MTKRKAFTLIELLVVIAIVGILSGLIVVSMSGMTKKASIAKVQIFNDSLKNSLLGNLKGEWSLNGSGDDTWNHLTSAVSASAPTASTDCAVNACYTFASASTQSFSTPNTNGVYTMTTSPMTAMVWVKGASQVGKAIFANWDNTAAYKGAWKIFSAANGTSLRVILADTTTQTNAKDYSSATADVAMDSTWHLVGFTWSGTGGTLTLYIDGVALADASLTKTTNLAVTSLSANGTASAPITIACDVTSSTQSNFFNGSIDSARLYGAAIPTSQIKEEYFAGLKNLLASGKMSSTEYFQKVSAFALNK
jgi:prepilin-type N-terminal cleavage/methylation domain-containing protein